MPLTRCCACVRVQMAENLRKKPYHVNLLLGGFDDTGASLYWMDYLGTLQKMNFGAHGHCSNFIVSVMDRYWKVRRGAVARSLSGLSSQLCWLLWLCGTVFWFLECGL
jgi:20S proteasome alpha/beta subunit